MKEKNIEKLIAQIQRDVSKQFKEAFDSPLKQEWAGSAPIAGFDERGVFSEENWNDARINLFRAFFSGLFHDGISDQVVYIGDVEIGHMWQDDQNFVFIRNVKSNDVYYVTWYKSRGRTDLILHNGKKITLENYKKLLNEMLKPIAEQVY